MKKLFSLLLATLLLAGLVACGGDEGTEESEPVEAPVHTADAPEEVEPEPEPLNQVFLTGLEKDADYPEGTRIGAIMVNNIAKARPQRGLSQADVLVEIVTEGGISRFMALYQDYKNIPVVGPVRSARDQFFQLLLPYWGFYVHDGQSTPMTQYFKDWEYDDFNLDTGRYGASGSDPDNLNSLAWRDADRRAQGYDQEHTEYTSGANMAATVENNDLDENHTYGGTIFDFVSYNEEKRVPEDGDAGEVAVIHSGSYRSLFEYNSGTGKYDMSQWNSGKGAVEPTIDENNSEQLAFDNLLVLFAPMSIYDGTGVLVKADYGHGGAGYYFTQGKYELLLWRKGSPLDPLLLYKWEDNGEMVKINPGKTYLAMVNDTMLPDFDEYLKEGTAEDAVAHGEVNEDEVDYD